MRSTELITVIEYRMVFLLLILVIHKMTKEFQVQYKEKEFHLVQGLQRFMGRLHWP